MRVRPVRSRSGESPRTTRELQVALEALPSRRLQRLVDCLAANPDFPVGVDRWDRCPMTLAGFDHQAVVPGGPERRFAVAWDRYAGPTARRRLADLIRGHLARSATTGAVQDLLRMGNAALAKRDALPPHGAIRIPARSDVDGSS